MSVGKAGRLVLRTARQVSKIYITAYVAAHMVRMADKKWAHLLKEGTMHPVFDARSLDLSHLNPVSVSYDPKNIHTEAIQVTPENIGKLSLEFEEELFYDVQGRPYFVFSAKRFDASKPDGQQDPGELYVRLTDWILPLWDELHVFRDGIFKNTFTFDLNTGGPDIMQAARHSSDSALSAFAEKVSNMRFTVPGEMVTNVYKFSPGDSVFDTSTGTHATVTVLDVDLGDGTFGIEIKLDDGTYRQVREEVLDYVPNPFKPESGTIEGPTGTGIMPRVED